MPTYTGISSEAFRHPLDIQAEQALRNLPGFDLVARKFVEFVYERPQLIYLLGNSIQVGPRQYSTIYQIFRECTKDLDIYPEPALFVSQNPEVNSYALGKEHPYIVVNTGLLDLLNEAEIKTVLAHELGHIKCGHTILIQMAMWAMNAASVISELTFGVGNFVSQALIYAFFEWRRKAELSADRAALLVMDDLNPIMSSMMKLAGGSHKYAHECSLQEFIQQSENYQGLNEDGLNQVYKFLTYNGAQGMILSHPFPVERLHYLRSWSVSQEYQEIKKGNYQRSADGSVNVTPETPETQAERLKKQIAELQEQINKMQQK
ncbi:M48 family metallopeptidase [Anabaena sp. FACHB-1237]|uniref:M48 family metallopeptidase n=1 Tax=Anabaena sp. FACHB-1237 TaxID=2692769 RepID=UPI0016807B9E|nr:M48 family metallopeptidase [Anabaena sp. FACHB-1237]MBD2138384.1 M48 family metallopeptidase [Anabaena sp. FACHB-1237]